jgi:hypothetical protein
LVANGHLKEADSHIKRIIFYSPHHYVLERDVNPKGKGKLVPVAKSLSPCERPTLGRVWELKISGHPDSHRSPT